jgi:hypothetical protein
MLDGVLEGSDSGRWIDLSCINFNVGIDEGVRAARFVKLSSVRPNPLS